MTPLDLTRRELFAMGASTVLASSSGCLSDALGANDPEQSVINLNQSGTLLTPSSTTTQSFGDAIALSGDTILVGSSKVSNAEPSPVLVFGNTQGTWSKTQTLSPLHNTPSYQFGTALALDNDQALVLETKDTDGDQQTQLFVHAYSKEDDSWRHDEQLWSAPSGDVAVLPSLSLNGETALIGNPNTQRAHYFERTAQGWQQVGTSEPQTSTTGRYGISVDCTSTRAVIGDSRHQEREAFVGGAHVFQRSGTKWNEQPVVTLEDGDSKDYFGWAVALSDSRLLVSAPGDESPDGKAAGTAYLYSMTEDGFQQERKFWAPDLVDKHEYGIDVALSSGVSVVGAQYAPTRSGEFAGAAYVRKASDDWNMQYKLTDPNGMSTDRLGSTVETDGSHAVIAAFNHRATTTASNEEAAIERPGGVYVINLDEL